MPLAKDPVLTLAIDVDDVQRVLFAQEKGTIWFASRPPGSAQNVMPARARRRRRASWHQRRPLPAHGPAADGSADGERRTRLSIAAHREFPGQLLDGAIPNGESGLLVASGMSDFGRALMAADRDNSQALLMFTPTRR